MGLGFPPIRAYFSAMETATVTKDGDRQTVRLPKGIHLSANTVYVRQDGDSVVLEPVRASAWPAGFFDSILIDDPAFERPPQGHLPPVKPI
jgi:virulence-associated protein VagC